MNKANTVPTKLMVNERVLEKFYNETKNGTSDENKKRVIKKYVSDFIKYTQEVNKQYFLADIDDYTLNEVSTVIFRAVHNFCEKHSKRNEYELLIEPFFTISYKLTEDDLEDWNTLTTKYKLDLPTIEDYIIQRGKLCILEEPDLILEAFINEDLLMEQTIKDFYKMPEDIIIVIVNILADKFVPLQINIEQKIALQ